MVKGEFFNRDMNVNVVPYELKHMSIHVDTGVLSEVQPDTSRNTVSVELT